MVRATNPGARSEATPMAILPRARLTATSLPSISRSYEIGGRRLHDRLSVVSASHNAAILPSMGDSDRRTRSRLGRVLDGLIWGPVLGAASGAVLGDAIDG